MKEFEIDICKKIQYSLKKINMNIRYVMMKEFDSSPVTLHQLFMIKSIKDNPKMNLTGLSEHLNLSKSSVCLMTNKLVDEGYILRKENPKDRRNIYLITSPKGEEVLEDMKPLQKQIFTKLLFDLKFEDMVDIEKNLKKLNKSIEKAIQKFY